MWIPSPGSGCTRLRPRQKSADRLRVEPAHVAPSAAVAAATTMPAAAVASTASLAPARRGGSGILADRRLVAIHGRGHRTCGGRADRHCRRALIADCQAGSAANRRSNRSRAEHWHAAGGIDVQRPRRQSQQLGCLSRKSDGSSARCTAAAADARHSATRGRTADASPPVETEQSAATTAPSITPPEQPATTDIAAAGPPTEAAPASDDFAANLASTQPAASLPTVPGPTPPTAPAGNESPACATNGVAIRSAGRNACQFDAAANSGDARHGAGRPFGIRHKSAAR